MLNPTPTELRKLSAENAKRIYYENLERLTPWIEDIEKEIYKAARDGMYSALITLPYPETDRDYRDYNFIRNHFETLGFKVTARNEYQYMIRWTET